MTPQKEQAGNSLLREFLFNPSNKPIRLELIDNQVYFIAKDLCDILDLKDTNKALQNLDDDEKLTRKIFVSGQQRKMWLVNESGMYALIIRSNQPIGRQLRKHITSVILPALRENGYYSPSVAPSGGDATRIQKPTDIDLVRQASRLVGAQRNLAILCNVSESVICDIIRRPGKIRAQLQLHVVSISSRVINGQRVTPLGLGLNRKRMEKISRKLLEIIVNTSSQEYRESLVEAYNVISGRA